MKYGSTEEAKKAYDTLNGKEITLEDSDQNVTLYVNFVEKGINILLSHKASLFFLCFSVACYSGTVDGILGP